MVRGSSATLPQALDLQLERRLDPSSDLFFRIGSGNAAGQVRYERAKTGFALLDYHRESHRSTLMRACFRTRFS